MKKLLLIPALILALTGFFTAADAKDVSAAPDFRAVWVSTVYQIDYPTANTTDEAKLKAQANAILDNCAEMGMTAVILQVRPAADAFYRSDIFPWSKYISGKQGVAPQNDFDPLQYWVQAAHSRGLELHAWLNPYRVAVSKSDFDALSADHPARLHPEWVIAHDGKYYFDPGLPETRQLVVDGAAEIVKNYDVDGIHLDDYFYPGTGFADSKTFAAYAAEGQSLGDWRRANNDELIQTLYSTVKTLDKDADFGVSPAGIWANQSKDMPLGSATRGNQTYFGACADTYKWVKEGWLDYICPQIYWHIGYEIADYRILAHWWADVVKDTGVALYIGMPDYRYGTGGVWNDVNTIGDQLKLNRTIPQVAGEVHFTYSNLAEQTALKNLYIAEYTTTVEPPDGLPLLEKTAHNAYMEGSQGAFRPDGSLTRAEAATLFTRLIVTADGRTVYDGKQIYGADFRDVAVGKWFSNPIGFISQYGVMQGAYGKFRPGENITRAEFATILGRFTGLQSSAENPFSDIDGHWAKAAILSAYSLGLIQGYGDGRFGPQQTITRAEAVTMLNRLLERYPDEAYIAAHPALNTFSDLTSGYWAYAQIIEATHGHDYKKNGKAEIWN